jgi:hypothetical protein
MACKNSQSTLPRNAPSRCWAVVYGKAVGPEILGNIGRASNYWSRGDAALAEIELALGALQPLNDVEAFASPIPRRKAAR